MVNAARLAAAALALLGAGLAWADTGGKMRVVELALPRAPAANETADLEVQTGVLVRGAQIDIATSSGELIGTISPFAIPAHQPAGTYTFPLDASEIHGGRITVRLSVRNAGMPARAPTSDEVRNVSIAFTRIAP